jgi:hypothetical protein
MSKQTARLTRFLQHWWEGQLVDGAYPSEWRRERSAEGLASELRRDIHFELNQTTLLHRRPSEEAARDAVSALVPAPSDEDADLLVAAVVRAGGRARTVRATTGVGAMITVFALVLRNILRGR